MSVNLDFKVSEIWTDVNYRHIIALMSIPAYIKYIGLSLLFLMATINFSKTTISVVQSSRRLDNVKSEVENLEKQKISLQNELEYRQGDLYVEQEARNKLGMVKPGEYLFIAGNVLSEKTYKEDSIRDIPTPENNLSLWLHLFF